MGMLLGTLEYQVHRIAGWPRQQLLRHRERHKPQHVIDMLEATRFRRPAYDFIVAMMVNPSILYDFDLSTDDLAVDVGAFEGEWASRISDTYGCTVDAFDLSPRFNEPLAAVADSHPKVQVHHVGLGAADELVRVSKKSMGSSAFAHPGDSSDQVWDEARIRDVAGVWDELGWTRVAAMKMNIEGGEYDLLERLIATGLHARVDAFTIQFHEWLPDAYRRRRRIRKALNQTHVCDWNYPFIWEKWSRRRNQQRQ